SPPAVGMPYCSNGLSQFATPDPPPPRFLNIDVPPAANPADVPLLNPATVPVAVGTVMVDGSTPDAAASAAVAPPLAAAGPPVVPTAPAVPPADPPPAKAGIAKAANGAAGAANCSTRAKVGC